jgi:intracellular multiplication protein IcmV
MGFFKSIAKLGGHIVDIRVDRWFNLQGHQDNLRYLSNLARQLLKSPAVADPNNTAKSFDAVIDRDGLTPAWLNQQSQHYKNIALLFVGLAAILFIYSLVLIYLGNWMGLCISAALIVYAFSQAFRFHFWHYQILKRSLDCTPKEWARFVTRNNSDV